MNNHIKKDGKRWTIDLTESYHFKEKATHVSEQLKKTKEKAEEKMDEKIAYKVLEKETEMLRDGLEDVYDSVIDLKPQHNIKSLLKKHLQWHIENIELYPRWKGKMLNLRKHIYLDDIEYNIEEMKKSKIKGKLHTTNYTFRFELTPPGGTTIEECLNK